MNKASDPAAPTRPVVLFCDDAPSVRFVVRNALIQAGYEAVEAEDGVAALAILSGPRRVDLLLTDLNMPGIDGFEVVRQTRALPHRRFMPIVMLTTESLAASIRAGARSGLTAWIVKPFEAQALQATVAKVLSLKSGGELRPKQAAEEARP